MNLCSSVTSPYERWQQLVALASSEGRLNRQFVKPEAVFSLSAFLPFEYLIHDFTSSISIVGDIAIDTDKTPISFHTTSWCKQHASQGAGQRI